jgi:hypothetical protein
MRTKLQSRVAALVLVAIAGGVVLADPALPAEQPKLAPPVREFLVTYRKQAPAKWPVDVMITAVPGRSKAVAERVGELEGKVVHRVDEVGYLRVRVPVEVVEKLAEFPGVEALDLCDLASEVAPDWRAGTSYFGPVSAKEVKNIRTPRPEIAPLDKKTRRQIPTCRRATSEHPSSSRPTPNTMGGA